VGKAAEGDEGVEAECGMVETVVRVEGMFVYVQWHNVAVEDEMGVEELVSTGTFQTKVPHHARVLDGSEDGELVTFYDEANRRDDATILV
jgi:hypothetical protein